jgi:hypothetical protein
MSFDARSLMPLVASFDADVGVNCGATPTATTNPGANLGLFVPHRVHSATWLRRFWVIIGNTTGTISMGIYRTDGTLVIGTGTQSMAASNVVLYYSVTATLLPPGEYYLGISRSTTNSIAAVTTVGMSRAIGVCQMASAHPLPAFATFVAAAQDYVPYFGYSTLAAPM